jgi:signal transduction histidine kinase
LISEILVLARVDADNASAEAVDLNALLGTLQKDAQLGSPEQTVRLNAEPQLNLTGWPTMIERAVDNLLRNAQRFNPVGQPIEMQATRQRADCRERARPWAGRQAEHLSQLGEPFYRAPGQTAPDMAWAWRLRRAAERHGGSLTLANHPEGGFIASLELPLVPGAVVQP